MDRYERYAEDALVLGRIGAALFPQDTSLSVRLPKDLADLALAAWHRDDPPDSGPVGSVGPEGSGPVGFVGPADSGPVGFVGPADSGPAGPEGSRAGGTETAGQRGLRERAAYLALIGLCVENTAQPDGDDIVCDLDSWYIGGALQAAEALDMLPGRVAGG